MASIVGTSGNDLLSGTQGGDTISALVGNDNVSGLADNDLINGNQGFDTLFGGQGFDTLFGGRGNDSLRGGRGNDLLVGDVGNDILWGDRGFDTLTGGSGDDLFAIAIDSDTDTIIDFSSGDLIGLADGQTFQNLNIVASGSNTAIQDRTTGQTLAILNGVNSATVDAADFVPIGSSSSLVAVSQGSSAANNFDIRFDYRYDTNGFFSDPARRASLEAAASVWESMIKDEFADIPVGTETPFVFNPQTGSENIFFTDTPIDDLLVFVGAADLTGATLAQAGPSGAFINEPRYSSANFEPWIGSMAFSAEVDWFFDSTPNSSDNIPADSFDFFSTALHELAHVMGFGTSDAFDALISGSSFTGASATALNGGAPVPLEPLPDLGHIEADYTLNGTEPLMNPSSAPGTRSFATPIDIAILADIGYLIT